MNEDDKLKCRYCGVKFGEIWDKTLIKGENISFEMCSQCFAEIERNRENKNDIPLLDSTILIAQFGDKVKLFVTILLSVIKNYFQGMR